jgi:5-methyltetrahydrofolate--homocysteine methyltransferase
MATQLAEAGLEMGGQNCISHPDEVFAIHRKYAQAGCDILITNTLTMNRIYLESHGMDVDVKEVNLAGARLARSAADEQQYVLGDISSTGQFLEPYGEYSEEQFYHNFAEQAKYLLAGNIDGFIIETVLDGREALCAVRACRDASTLPIIASLSFQTPENGGRTIMGNSAAGSAQALVEAGATAVGANCGVLDPHETAGIITMMSDAVAAPLIAQPNAGKPRLVNDRTVFNMNPEKFTQGISECIAAGARLVGGCCGTTPEHIRKVAEMIRKNEDWRNPG